MNLLQPPSTLRANKSVTFAHHGTLLMTPPPTPQKSKDKPKSKHRHISKDNKHLEVAVELEGKDARKRAKRERRRQAACAGQRVSPSTNNKVNCKHVTSEAVTNKATLVRSDSLPTATGHEAPPALPSACSPLTPTPITSHNAQGIERPRAFKRRPIVATLQAATNNAYDSEALHDLELERLMTLQLQRNDSFRHSLNPLEQLLAIDDLSSPVAHDPDSKTSTLAAAHAFIRGMQAEQSDLCQMTDELEMSIRAMKTDISKLTEAERVQPERLERMLGLTIALCFELLLEEGAFRDVCDKRMGDGWFDLDDEFGELTGRIGEMVEAYDEEMGELRRALGGY
jgi:hypothetical protein